MKNMKKTLCILCLALLAALAVFLVACDEPKSPTAEQPSGEQPGTPDNEQPGTPEDELQQFTGITFANKTVTYDGTEHTITVTGTLPDGAQVAYTNNAGTNAGTYDATATLTADNYETLTLRAVLTVQKATFTGITFENDTVIFDNKEHSLAVQGELPQGTAVRYENNGKTAAGEYTVKAILENPNYETLTLTATLYIRSLPDAKAIIDKLLTRPDAWSFMPEVFAPANMAHTALPQTDFASDFVSVETIEKRAIGKQMNVVYDILNKTQSVLSKADIVFAAGETIAAAYQTFINNNPDDYTEFSGSVTIAGIPFSMKIALQDDASVLLLGNETVSVELRADSEQNINIGRIGAAGAALKYQATDASLKLALDIEISDAKVAQSLEFVREEDAVAGYVYEYYGVGSAAIKTTALISSNDTYTVITGNKRETDDLLIEAYEEVYSSTTGNMIGAEVTETVKVVMDKTVDFDTLWFPLADVQGFTNVKVLDETNGLNADTVFVNGSATAFETKNIGGIGLDTGSRRYDIEMKEVWYIVRQTDGEEVTYTKEKALIPMLFVQNKSLEDFADDVTEKNDSVTNAALPDTAPVTGPFTAMQDSYLALKELVTYDEIKDFIGEEDAFFQTAQA